MPARMNTARLDDDPQVAGPYPIEGSYHDRDSKAHWIARVFSALLHGRVLDVGCDEGRLRGLLAEADYTGVDLNPRADLVLDLERESLPFADRSFDCVLCTDVLEHLSDPHRVLDDLLRVSADAVIISLPNCVRSLLFAILGGSGGHLKHYGLPVDPPGDRHKWFFGFCDAAAFVRTRGERAGFVIEQLQAADESGPYWIGPGGRDLLESPNIRLGTMWCVLRRGRP